jgi:hypothetical protein
VTTGQWHQALDEPAISSRPAVGMSILENLQLAPNKEAKIGVDSPADESNDDTEGNSIKIDQTFREADLLWSSSVYIPAPLSAAAAAKSSPGKVVIPAVVDQMQQHALEALQALKVGFTCLSIHLIIVHGNMGILSGIWKQSPVFTMFDHLCR